MSEYDQIFDICNFVNMPEYAWNITGLNKLQYTLYKADTIGACLEIISVI